jgi:hypothetical protein
VRCGATGDSRGRTMVDEPHKTKAGIDWVGVSLFAAAKIALERVARQFFVDKGYDWYDPQFEWERGRQRIGIHGPFKRVVYGGKGLSGVARVQVGFLTKVYSQERVG